MFIITWNPMILPSLTLYHTANIHYPPSSFNSMIPWHLIMNKAGWLQTWTSPQVLEGLRGIVKAFTMHLCTLPDPLLCCQMHQAFQLNPSLSGVYWLRREHIQLPIHQISHLLTHRLELLHLTWGNMTGLLTPKVNCFHQVL